MAGPAKHALSGKVQGDDVVENADALPGNLLLDCDGVHGFLLRQGLALSDLLATALLLPLLHYARLVIDWVIAIPLAGIGDRKQNIWHHQGYHRPADRFSLIFDETVDDAAGQRVAHPSSGKADYAVDIVRSNAP